MTFSLFLSGGMKIILIGLLCAIDIVAQIQQLSMIIVFLSISECKNTSKA
jgi:hypothetical protein